MMYDSTELLNGTVETSSRARSPMTLTSMSPRDHSLSMHARFMPSLSSFTLDNEFFNILHHNAGSIFRKVGYYTSLPNFSNYQAISIVETWLRPSLTTAMLEFPN